MVALYLISIVIMIVCLMESAVAAPQEAPSTTPISELLEAFRVLSSLVLVIKTSIAMMKKCWS